MYIYIYNIYTPGTQMTTVLIGIWAFFWRVFQPQKIEDVHRFQVPGPFQICEISPVFGRFYFFGGVNFSAQILYTNPEDPGMNIW